MGFTSDFKRVDGGVSYSVPYFTLNGSAGVQRLAIEKTGALFSTAYLAAEQAKIRALGSLPCHVYRDIERGREPVKEHPLQRLVARRWNPVMTAQTGLQWLSLRRDTFGTAYVRVAWSQGKPVALYPIESDVTVGFDPAADVSPVRYEVLSDDRFTKKGVYLDREVLAFPTCISTDGGVTGRSLADLAAEDIGLSIDLTRFYRNIISKGFNPGGYLEHERTLSIEEVQVLARKNAELSGTDHAGEVRIFDSGLKYHPVTASMAEADIVKQQEFILQSVARAVYVQPNKVMDFSRATYSNIGDAAIAFVTDTMTNEVTAIEAEFDKLFEFMGQSDTYIKFDLRGLQRGDFKDQMEGFRTGVYAGFYTQAEIREWLELPFIEGTDELLHPSAYFRLDPETGEPQELPYAPSRRAPSESASSMRPVLDDAIARIRTRLERDGDVPKTREYARGVLAPVAQAFTAAGEPFSIEAAVKEAIDG